jgi:hypothetical protein
MVGRAIALNVEDIDDDSVMRAHRKKKSSRYRAATIALAFAALGLSILAAMLWPIWNVPRAGRDSVPKSSPRPVTSPARPAVR